MSESINQLLELYKEQTNQARHHEQQRATITNFVLVVTGAVLGILGAEGFSSGIAAGAFLVGLGIFGAIAVAKHYERNRYHSRMAGAYRNRIEEMDKNLSIDRSTVRNDQASAFPLLNKQRLNRLWIGFHLFVSLLGIAIICPIH